MAEEKIRENKAEDKAEVYVGSIKDATENKDQKKATKDPRRLLQFWLKFREMQEKAYKAAGISTTAVKITNIKMVTGKDGKEAVRVDFAGGGGVVDVGDQAHIFRRLNRSMPRPSKLHLLMEAVKRRGWHAVMAEVDASTREALAKACARAGIKMCDKEEKKKAGQVKPLTPKAPKQTLQQQIKAQDPEETKKKVTAVVSIVDSLKREAIAAEEAKKKESANGLLSSGAKTAAAETMWRVGSKPSDRRDELHSSRQTNNAQLMECRRIESRLLSEIKTQHNQIVAAAKQGFDEKQIVAWREKYYGSKDKEGLKSRIEQKKKTGAALTSAEAKLVRVVEQYGIKSHPAMEHLTPEQKSARTQIPANDYDQSIGQEFRDMKARKKAIADIKKKSVEYACSDYRLKVLKSNGKIVPPPSREKIVAQATALIPAGKRETSALIETQKGLGERLKTVKKSCAAAHEAQKSMPKTDTQEQINTVTEKVKTQTEKQTGNAQKTTSKKKGKAPQQKTPATKKPVTYSLAPQNVPQSVNPQAAVRGGTMLKFIAQQRANQR